MMIMYVHKWPLNCDGIKTNVTVQSKSERERERKIIPGQSIPEGDYSQMTMKMNATREIIP